MSPTPSGSPAIQLIEGGDVLKIHNVLIFERTATFMVAQCIVL